MCTSISTSITFQASFAPIDSAVERSTRGNGYLFKLETPESEIGNTFRLNIWIKELFEVSVRKDNATVQFKARLEDSDRALMRSGNGGGRKIQLRVPESEVASAMEMEMWTKGVFEITLRVLDEQERNDWIQQNPKNQSANVQTEKGVVTVTRSRR